MPHSVVPQRYVATARTSPLVSAMNAWLAAGAVGLAASIWNHAGGSPGLVLSAASTVATIVVAIVGVRTDTSWARIAYRVAWANVITLWPIWFIAAGQVIWPLLGLVVVTAILILVEPVTSKSAGTGPAKGELAEETFDSLPAAITLLDSDGPLRGVTIGVVPASALDVLVQGGWRFSVAFRTLNPAGTKVTFLPQGTTADDLVALIEETRRKGRIE